MNEEGWIKVKDKLPFKRIAVLTFGKAYGIVIGYFGDDGRWCAQYTDFETGEPYLADGVITHWMPLPEEPE